MCTATIQKEQQSALQEKLWVIANDLRGNMDASEFKNYILGLMSGILAVILLNPLSELLLQWIEEFKTVPTLKILRANAEINNLMKLQEVQLQELQEAYERDFKDDEDEE